MTKPKLIYFDAPVSRGEECRIALHLAGIDFEDVRVKRPDWPAVKANAPFNTVPVLEWPGHPPLGQSNAILTLIGRRHDLHPKDDFEAARHEAIMEYVEDLRHAITPSLRTKDEVERKAMREALAETTIPTWAANIEKQLGEGPWFGGAKLHVVDLKLFVMTRWLRSGTLDHIPTTVIDGHPKLARLHDAVRDHAGVVSWHART